MGTLIKSEEQARYNAGATASNSTTSSSNSLYSEAEQVVIDRALEIIKAKVIKGKSINSPDSIARMLQLKLAGLEYEAFGVVYLSSQHKVIGAIEPMITGTIDNCSVYPREILKEVIAKNASAVILFHNHPSGNPEPSQADKAITNKIADCLDYIDVRVLDHIIVGSEGWGSLSNEGVI